MNKSIQLQTRLIKAAYSNPKLRRQASPYLKRIARIHGIGKTGAAVGALVGALVRGLGAVGKPLLKGTLSLGKGVAKGVAKGLSKGVGKATKGLSKIKLKAPKLKAKLKSPGKVKVPKKVKPSKMKLKKTKSKKIEAPTKPQSPSLKDQVKSQVVNMAVSEAASAGLNALAPSQSEGGVQKGPVNEGDVDSQIKQVAKNEYDAYKEKYPGTEKTVADFEKAIRDEYSRRKSASELGGLDLEEVIKDLDTFSDKEVITLAELVEDIDVENSDADEDTLRLLQFLEDSLMKRLKRIKT